MAKNALDLLKFTKELKGYDIKRKVRAPETKKAQDSSAEAVKDGKQEKLFVGP